MQQSASSFADLPQGVVRADRLPAAEMFPTGLQNLDAILPHGGIPRGRLTEIHGPLMGGRLTIALALLRRCLQQGERAAFVDLPRSFYPVTLPPPGAPGTHSLLVIRPAQSTAAKAPGETHAWTQAFRATEILARSREWSLVILDLTGHGRHLPEPWLQRLAREARASRAAIVLLHDQPANPQAGAIGLRLAVCRTGAAGGRALSVRITKNKLAAPGGVATIPLGMESEGP